ncbi:hypothetical protein ACPWSR_12825 [Alloiococcus sp. CFN-8]|uniref:hypothetical protein n=1 Tax=Alloiococcus sp. CFN-8 TaxID=3416081 RepID=UPI003CED6D20
MRVDERVQEKSRYVAISPYSVKPLCIKNKGLINLINSSLVEVIEKPYDLELIIKSKSGQGALRWIISREKWQKEFSGMPPESLYLSPEELILLED